MSLLTITTHAPAQGRDHAPGLADRLVATLGHAWRRWREHRARNATVTILHGLDDRTLGDIGLNRSEVESVVHDADGEHLRRYEPGWTSHRRRRPAVRAADWM